MCGIAPAENLLRLHHGEPLKNPLYRRCQQLRRVREHKLGIGSTFTARYKLDRLVYFERFDDIRNAIEREKQIKGWLRIKKIALIVSATQSGET